MILAGALLLVAAFITAIVLSLLAAAGEADDYTQRLQHAYERDMELGLANIELTEQLGREPTARELWNYCPPQ